MLNRLSPKSDNIRLDLNQLDVKSNGFLRLPKFNGDSLSICGKIFLKVRSVFLQIGAKQIDRLTPGITQPHYLAEVMRTAAHAVIDIDSFSEFDVWLWFCPALSYYLTV